MSPVRTSKLEALLSDIRACTLCAGHLPLGPRPVVQAARKARVLVVGQAPGTKVHASGIPFDDPSGDRLRAWMGVTADQFYDPTQVALVPMGFCYPGRKGSGDAPPRPECAPAWRQRLLDQLPNIELTLVIGRWAMDWHMPQSKRETLTHRVAAWQDSAPSRFPLPHPSPRNNIWLRRNPWFEADVVPAIQRQVSKVLRP